MVVALAGALLIPTTAPASAQERTVDLELVLAVDASASVSDAEFELQVRGLAEAFRHRSLGHANRAIGHLGRAVARVHGAGYHPPAVSVAWPRRPLAARARSLPERTC